MSIIAAAKCCLFCKKSWFSRNKAEHQKDLFRFLESADNKADMDCEWGIIDHDEHEEIVEFRNALEQACLICDGKTADVYFMVYEREFVEQEIEVEENNGVKIDSRDNILHIKNRNN